MKDGWFDRLKKVIRDDGRNLKALSVQASLGQNYLQQMFKRDTPPKLDALTKILSVLSKNDADFVSEGLQSSLSLPVAEPTQRPVFSGYVRAGWFELNDSEMNQDPEGVPEYVISVPRWSRARQYAYKCIGDSMVDVGIYDGMWVVAADAADYEDFYGDIITGDLVVVERARFERSEIELTIKEAHFFRNHYELRPRSPNTAHQTIIVQRDHSGEDDVQVRMVAVVLAAYTDLHRTRR